MSSAEQSEDKKVNLVDQSKGSVYLCLLFIILRICMQGLNSSFKHMDIKVFQIKSVFPTYVKSYIEISVHAWSFICLDILIDRQILEGTEINS